MQRTELEHQVVVRSPLSAHVGKSGASLERWLLDDGETVVAKRLVADSDLLMSLTHDSFAREYSLWATGLLDHLPARVGHAIVGGWQASDGAVVVMRDLGKKVLTWDDRLDAERSRWVLGRLADLHRAFAEVPLDPWARLLTPLPVLLNLFSPVRLLRYVDGPSVLPRMAIRGWRLFDEMVAPDVAGPVERLLRDPRPLAAALRRHACTLTHGDVTLVNMALDSDVLVLLDWSMPAQAPGSLDVARFIAGCASVVDLTREEIVAAYAEAAGPAYDEAAMHLALLAAAVWLGWNKALDAAENPDPVIRVRERDDLEWWVRQARTTIRSGLL